MGGKFFDENPELGCDSKVAMASPTGGATKKLFFHFIKEFT